MGESALMMQVNKWIYTQNSIEEIIVLIIIIIIKSCFSVFVGLVYILDIFRGV